MENGVKEGKVSMKRKTFALSRRWADTGFVPEMLMSVPKQRRDLNINMAKAQQKVVRAMTS